MEKASAAVWAVVALRVLVVRGDATWVCEESWNSTLDAVRGHCRSWLLNQITISSYMECNVFVTDGQWIEVYWGVSRHKCVIVC